jgi:hypothetical protein
MTNSSRNRTNSRHHRIPIMRKNCRLMKRKSVNSPQRPKAFPMALMKVKAIRTKGAVMASQYLTIEDGKIVDAQYSEINGQDNLPKSEENGYTYEDALKAFDILPERLKEVQDVDKVDVVSKATGTSNKFKTAAKNALYKASQQQGDSGDNDTDTDAEDENQR